VGREDPLERPRAACMTPPITGARIAVRAVRKEIALMRKETEPLVTNYAWARRWYNQQQGQNAGCMAMIIPLLCWNDSYDIAALHNQIQVGLNQGNPVGGTAPPLSKFAVGNYTGKFSFKNTTNIECIYDLYMATSRDDADETIVAASSWGNNGGLSYPALQNLIAQGLYDAAGRSQQYNNPLQFPIGATPFDSPTFCTYFRIKVLKRDQVLMGAGFKAMSYSEKRWNMWNGLKIRGCTNTRGTDTMFAGRTKMIFGIFRSQAVTQTGQHTAAANYAPVDIVTEGSEKYSVTAVNNATRYFNYSADVATSITGSNLGTIDWSTEQTAGYVVM
jgi:hypothetical protein